jgi:hypothetical protein
MATKKKMLQAAAGSATGGAGGAGLDITDVFSTYLYEGTGSAQTINNGIDLDGEGGLVWVKNRDTTDWHQLCDTERGSGKILFSNSTNGQVTNNNTISGFSASGFSLSGDGAVNTNGENYASWTFRKSPKFFDVVTYSGDGVAGRTISHNLGSVPGMIVTKRLDTTSAWTVYHRGMDSTAPEDYSMYLNSTGGRTNSNVYWNDTAPTDSVFTVSNNNLNNGVGATYVAYLFAHNDGDGEFGPAGDQDIIKCGGYAGNNSSNGPEIDLGFEPQWIMIKNSTGSQSWWVHDTMRGLVTGSSSNDSDDARLKANATTAEDTNNHLHVTPTGFKITSALSGVNESEDYIYMAIRRGPLAPPESATEVFDVTSYTANNTDNRLVTTGNVVDTVLARNYSQTSERGFNVGDRIRGLDFLGTAVTYADGGDGDSFMGFDHMNGFKVGNDATRRLNYSNYSQIAYTWKRAPNFFDVVAYTGDGVAGRTVSHNLGVAPEMMWVKERANSNSWGVYHSSLGATKGLVLNLNNAENTTTIWNSTEPSATDFTVSSASITNRSGSTFIAYLFASLPGISKVGSYTGNGSSQTIDCGFTAGARCVLIKRSDGNGGWYVWDTARGIVADNDARLDLNAAGAENANVDEIDPHSSGFIVNEASGGQSAQINGNNDSYIFYAIA